MGKKHKNKRRLDADVETLAARAAAAVTSNVTSVTQDQPTEQEPTVNVCVPELPEPQPVVEVAEVHVVDKSVAKPNKVATPSKPDIFTPVAPPKNGVKFMAEDVFPSRSQMQINAGIPAKHTAVGDKLIKFLDEYDAMIAVPTTNKLECKHRVMKLYQALQTACPTAEMHQVTANDVTRIVFDRFMKNWGTLYNDGNLFRLDYSLPGGGPSVDKLNMYFTAILELVQAARDPQKRIMFDNGRLGSVLKNTSVLNAIVRLKDGITRRQRQVRGEI